MARQEPLDSDPNAFPASSEEFRGSARARFIATDAPPTRDLPPGPRPGQKLVSWLLPCLIISALSLALWALWLLWSKW
jgi:hypothetical protein